MVRLHPMTLPLPGGPVDAVDAVLHVPPRPAGVGVVLAPGAGGSLEQQHLVALADLVAAFGSPVVRVNLPHHQRGARAPRAESSVGPFVALLAAACEQVREHVPDVDAWVVGGKSYGGRVASLAVADGVGAAGPDVAGLLLYGYPLHPPGRPDRLRVAHWPAIDVPCLFLHGTHDAFGGAELLAAHVHRLPQPAVLHVVEGGDHSLHVTGARSPTGRPRSPAVTLADAGPVVASWLAARAGGHRDGRPT